ncbi:hypothetical protein ETD85_54380 [Nonomuraea zeae]|uniref:Uncharacterized protein n=1 Tax=Nonomuraea zeae TaxID=1642303 RepID=A0A5S4FES2_9ACTN|nr:hypothetical protein ETD85_54380 [Nonomuraea zeae]
MRRLVHDGTVRRGGVPMVGAFVGTARWSCGDAPRDACAATGPQAAARRRDVGAGRTAARRAAA